MAPQMRGILDAKGRGRKGRAAIDFSNPRVVVACVLIGGLALAFYVAVEFIRHAHIHIHPLAFLALPPLTAGSIGLLLPLFMYVASADDFRDLNPLFPTHYAYLFKKTYRALLSNERLRAEGKDL
ncbi:unnamed protein product [Pedinophyceae sp. YPF-701]|nr:unnamed protein product [Pedinophyceae sp. YPF-701]